MPIGEPEILPLTQVYRTTSRNPIPQQVSEATFGPQSQFRRTVLHLQSFPPVWAALP